MNTMPIDTQLAILWMKKHPAKDNITTLTNWIHEWSNTNLDPQTDLYYIYDFAKKLFIEYITCCDRPGVEVLSFIDKLYFFQDNNYMINFISSVVSILRLSKVKNKNEFVNGFTTISDEDKRRYDL